MDNYHLSSQEYVVVVAVHRLKIFYCPEPAWYHSHETSREEVACYYDLIQNVSLLHNLQ